MLKIAAEIPPSISYLHSYTDYEFIIASHCLACKEYYDYYKPYAGRDKYLDNGAFELGSSIDSNAYINVIREIKPHVVVLPDVVNDFENTKYKSNKFKREVYHPYVNEFEGIRFMGVLQGISQSEYLKLLDYYSDFKNLYIIGIPYHLFYRPKLINDLNIIKACEERALKIHLLGLVNPFEILEYKGMTRVVESIDTSLPITSGLNLKKFKDYQWKKERLDIGIKTVNKKQLISCENNLEWLCDISVNL